MTPRPSGTCAMPLVTMASTGARVMSSPSSRTCPRSQRTSPLIVRSSVVFPAPLAPRTAVIRPVSALSETPSSARTGPYDVVRSRTSSSGAPATAVPPPAAAPAAVLPVARDSLMAAALLHREGEGGDLAGVVFHVDRLAEVGGGDGRVGLHLGRRSGGDEDAGVQHGDLVAHS